MQVQVEVEVKVSMNVDVNVTLNVNVRDWGRPERWRQEADEEAWRAGHYGLRLRTATAAAPPIVISISFVTAHLVDGGD